MYIYIIIGTECPKLLREFPSLTLNAFRKIDRNERRSFFNLSGSCSLVPLKYMSGFMKTVIKTESGVF